MRGGALPGGLLGLLGIGTFLGACLGVPGCSDFAGPFRRTSAFFSGDGGALTCDEGIDDRERSLIPAAPPTRPATAPSPSAAPRDTTCYTFISVTFHGGSKPYMMCTATAVAHSLP